LAVLINEVAWSGTFASAQDEWIELHNPGSEPIDLSGWVLTDGGDINVALSGMIPAYSYYLLERTDNTTIADILADKIYRGSLKNSGETLWLKDPTGTVIDSANQAGDGWPAGNSSTRASMERRGGSDSFGNWVTFSGFGSVGCDAQGNPIAGTPRSLNSLFVPTPQPTPLATPTAAPTAFAPQSILINEVAWSGTRSSANDEWIELHNPGSETIDLTGWTLSDDRDIKLSLEETIAAHGFLLLERGDDRTVADVPADRIYTGGLTNSGETLWLRDPSGSIIDSANQDGGGWPAGAASPRASMERRGGTDRPGNWGSFTGYHGIGIDADGEPIQGTPRGTNSLHFPTPVPTQIPGVVRINEVLMRPRYDWEGEGLASTADEFIELYNMGPTAVNLTGWMLDDTPRGGSKPYKIGNKILEPGDYLVFFRSRTRIALNDRGDIVRLLGPDGQVINQIHYGKIRGYNLSYGRLPDGYGHCQHGLWPTPGRPNVLYNKEKWALDTGSLEVLFPNICPDGGRPEARFPRAARHPAQLNWWLRSGLMICRVLDR
jgi:hypothetical protein